MLGPVVTNPNRRIGRFGAWSRPPSVPFWCAVSPGRVGATSRRAPGSCPGHEKCQRDHRSCEGHEGHDIDPVVGRADDGRLCRRPAVSERDARHPDGRGTSSGSSSSRGPWPPTSSPTGVPATSIVVDAMAAPSASASSVQWPVGRSLGISRNTSKWPSSVCSMTPASTRVPSVPARESRTGPDVRRSARTPTACPGATRLGSAMKNVSPPWARTVAAGRSAAAIAAALEMIARRGPSSPGHGDGVSVGQFGAVAPFVSAQLIRPFGGPSTNGLSGLLAVT